MEEEVKYRVYYVDKRHSTDTFVFSEAYDTFEKANEIFNAIRNDNDVLDCHIKRETITKEIVVSN